MSDITPTEPYPLAEMTCARAECLAEPERDHTGGCRPLCGTCRQWPADHDGNGGRSTTSFRVNEMRTKQNAGPPTASGLQRDIKDTLRVRARWTPELHNEMAAATRSTMSAMEAPRDPGFG